MASKHSWKINLVPWDYNSEDHVTRMYDQRVACGWKSEEVPTYVQISSEGRRVLYWIEARPLTDTASLLRLAPRVPSATIFHPIGHIALAIQNPEDDEKIGLPRSGVVWVYNVYISYALQQRGFGAAAMSKVEHIATLEPLNASIMVLDTVAKEMHKMDWYDKRGLPRPLASNEEWYASLGYEKFGRKTVEQVIVDDLITLEIIFMKKALR